MILSFIPIAIRGTKYESIYLDVSQFKNSGFSDGYVDGRRKEAL